MFVELLFFISIADCLERKNEKTLYYESVNPAAIYTKVLKLPLKHVFVPIDYIITFTNSMN